MVGEEVFERPAIREDGGVPDFQAVFIHPDLHGRADGIIAVHECVENSLPQRGIRHGVTLDALDALISDGGLEILGFDEVDGSGALLEEGAMHLIVVRKFRSRAEVTDLNEGSGDEALRVRVEKQQGGALEVFALGELELVDQLDVRDAEVGRIEATAASGHFPEFPDGLRGQVSDIHLRHGNAVPTAALLAQEEAVESCALEFLQRAAATDVVVAAIADGVRVSVHLDGDPWLAIGMVEIDRYKDAQQVSNFVGEVLQQFGGICQADDVALVVASDFQAPPFRIGEAGDPAEVVVAPRLLPFGVLGFHVGHISVRLWQRLVCRVHDYQPSDQLPIAGISLGCLVGTRKKSIAAG